MSDRRQAGERRRALLALLAIACVLPMLAGAAVHRAPQAGAAVPAPRVDRPVQPEMLDPNPVKGWGVVGYREQIGITNKPQVWDFAQIGDRMFVAGSFTGVQRNYYGVEVPPAVQPQAFLAAFDVDTNEWIPTFLPTFDAPVFALAVGPDDKLLVGGAFGSVNGTARAGLVKIDPLTGAIDGGFGATTAQDGATFPNLVRELKVSGEWLYLAGDFNRVVGGGTRYGVYSVARVAWTNGNFDTVWRPRPTGAGVNDVEPDPTRGRVHLAGNFTAVNGSPSTASQAVVSIVDGSTVTNVADFVQDIPADPNEYGVAVQGDYIWTAGAEHNVQVLDTARVRRDWYRTGMIGTVIDQVVAFHSGGDYQVIEAMDDFVIAGCHCIRQSYGAGVQLDKLHYWSGANQYSSHSFAIAYDRVTRRPLSFIPALIGTYYGTWALGSDTNGCLYIGGDYQRAATGLMLGGYGRFCRPASAPQALSATPTGSTSLRLDWRAAEYSGSGLSRYRVTRNGAFLGETTGLTFSVGGLVANVATTFTVAAVATDGRVGPAATVVATLAADTSAPSTPGTVGLQTNGVDNVRITWAASTDNVGVAGYLVHRNSQFLRYVAGGATTTYTDTAVTAGQRYSYELRAQDGAGNNSAPSAPQAVTVAGTDTTPPSAPTNVQLGTNGTNQATVSWTASTDDIGVTGYLIHRNFQFLAYVPVGTTYTDNAVTAGQTHAYQVRGQDAAGNNSDPSAPARIAIAAGGVDTQPPSVPGNPQAVHRAGSGVTVSWVASTDNDLVRGYLVHRNGQFLAFLTAANTTYLDPAVTGGQNFAYEVRAQDRSLNNSNPTAPVSVFVP